MFFLCKIIIKIFFVFLIVFSSLKVLAFKSNVDSLKHAYKVEKKDSVKAIILKNIAYSFFYQSKFDSCSFYFKVLEQFAINTKNTEASADYYEGIGIVNLAQSNFKAASDFYFNALAIREKLTNKEKLGNLLRKIGDSYSLLLQTDIAQVYYQKALKVLDNTSNNIDYVVCLNNMANNYRRAKKYKSALEIYQKVMPLFDAQEPGKGKASTLEEMGICYSEMGDLKKATQLLLTSWSLAQKLDNQGAFKAHILHHLILTFGKIPDNIKLKQFEKISIQENQKIGAKKAVLEISEILQKLYFEEGNFKKALFYSNLSKENQKIISDDNQKKIISSLGQEYSFEKEKQKSDLEIINQKNRNKILLIGLVAISFLTIVALFLYFVLRKEKQKTQEANQKLNELNENLEIKVSARTKEIKKINQKLEAANEDLVDAIVKGQRIERKRVASTLHDNLGGQITALKYSFMAISQQETKAYQNCKELISNLYEDVRDFSHEMYPKDLEHGLENGLIIYLDRINQNTKKAFILHFENYKVMGEKIEFELFSIFQELITNTLKYSKVAKIEISYSKTKDGHTFSYSDFPENNVSGSGKGLNQIRERALGIKAEIQIVSSTLILFL